MLLLTVCSLVPIAVGVLLLVTAPPAAVEPSPAELSTSRPVIRPLHVRALAWAVRARRAAIRGLARPRRVRGPVRTVGADVTAAHRIRDGRVADLWSISDSHRPLPCR